MAGAVAVICVALFIQTLTVEVGSYYASLSLQVWRDTTKPVPMPELFVNNDIVQQYTFKEGVAYTAYCYCAYTRIYWEVNPYAVQGPETNDFVMYIHFTPSRYDNNMTISCVSSKLETSRNVQFVWDRDETTPIHERATIEDSELEDTSETKSKCLTEDNSTTCAIIDRSQVYNLTYRLYFKTKVTTL